MGNPFLWLISTLIWTYIYILVAAVVLSWLIAFNVVNVRNQFVAMLANFLYQRHRAGFAPNPQSHAQPGRHRHFAG